MVLTKLSIGLKDKELKQFGDNLVKANSEQLQHMLIMIQNHIMSRYKRGLM